jgi:hypothetical protein
MEYVANFEDKYMGIKSPFRASLLALGLFVTLLMLLIFLNVDFFDIVLFQSIFFFSSRGFHPLLFQCHTQLKMDDMELIIEKQFAFHKSTKIIPLHKIKSTSLKISGENLLMLQYQEADKDKSIRLCRFKEEETEKIEALNVALKENPFIQLKDNPISL